MVLKSIFLSSLLLTAASTAKLPTHRKAHISPDLDERDLPSYIDSQRSRSVDGMLANIGASGSESSGASAGVVIASPSTVNPNYLYSWVRDGALTMKTLVDELILGNTSLQSHIEDYVNATAHLQVLINPSGSLSDGSGLGEPKYQVNLTAFKGPWGRPQRDGPALRAITLMSYSQWLIDNGHSSDVSTRIWPIISNDLNYVAQYWNNTGFDLWEEVDGSSFFTILNQHRALQQGAAFASSIGQQCPTCSSQAPEVLCFLQSFWNGTSVVANINESNGRSGRDANTLLGGIAAFDIAGSCTDDTFQPCNSKMLATHKVLVDSFRGIYAVNANATAGKPAAIGRYPEDIYFGGNPWYLSTLAAAELLYDAIAQWKTQGSLTVDSTSAPFFADIYPSATQQTYANTTSDFAAIISAVSTYADGFVSIIENVTPANGSLNEQFNRNTSAPMSALDLTWSFASFVTMAQRRAGQFPTSWNSTSSTNPPSVCTGGGGGNGTYAPATAAGAPDITCSIAYSFNVLANTTEGQNVYVVGNTSQFGSWNPSQGWGMVGTAYTASDPKWYLNVPMYPGQSLQYKYVKYNSSAPAGAGQVGAWVFENQLRNLTTPACGSAMVTLNEVWSGP